MDRYPSSPFSSRARICVWVVVRAHELDAVCVSFGCVDLRVPRVLEAMPWLLACLLSVRSRWSRGEVRLCLCASTNATTVENDFMSSSDELTSGRLIIAIPTVQGRLCAHFGHCEQFALVRVDRDSKQIVWNRMVEPPPHEPGLLPRWLRERGVELVIAGGMGGRAQQLLKQFGIDLVVGAPPEPPHEIVQAYLENALQTGQNLCDH